MRRAPDGRTLWIEMRESVPPRGCGGPADVTPLGSMILLSTMGGTAVSRRTLPAVRHGLRRRSDSSKNCSLRRSCRGKQYRRLPRYGKDPCRVFIDLGAVWLYTQHICLCAG